MTSWKTPPTKRSTAVCRTSSAWLQSWVRIFPFILSFLGYFFCFGLMCLLAQRFSMFETMLTLVKMEAYLQASKLCMLLNQGSPLSRRVCVLPLDLSYISPSVSSPTLCMPALQLSNLCTGSLYFCVHTGIRWTPFYGVFISVVIVVWIRLQV